MTRPVDAHYQDPLDTLWIATAEAIGLRVVMDADAYASTDGNGTLFLCPPKDRDPDDCLAQMILHELCHSLVQGEESFAWPDWGLDNYGTRDADLEHACLRVQAALLSPLGLREVLAPTTDFRSYYDSLPPDPFHERSAEERSSIVRARAALARCRRKPWGPHLSRALEATEAIFRAVQNIPNGDDTLLQARLRPRSARHPSGSFEHLMSGSTCGDCAWSSRSEGAAAVTCQQIGGAVRPEWSACEFFEVPFDCFACGACCREAYDTVEVTAGDTALVRHLPLLVKRTGGYDMARAGSRCIALRGGDSLEVTAQLESSETSSAYRPRLPRWIPGHEPFHCEIYPDRPTSCREFELGSSHCLEARRAVGLSR